MKEFKMSIINDMKALATELNGFSLLQVAQANGINHIKTADVYDIINGFKKVCPEYKPYRLADEKNGSLFTTLFFSCNESLPYGYNK